ncbi:MAG: NAD(+)/NADH kinase [Patescibacteria group bacterium]|jgi:nicotinate (nicotinamide) nucleotide adenylyltransferase
MNKKIAIFGGSFNPAGRHHRAVAEALSQHFDEIIVVPCGPRPDKPIVVDIEPVHRAVMADLAFRGLPKVRVELFDLELDTYTRTIDLDRMFSREGEIWHVVGTDLVKGGRAKNSEIHHWERGPELWDNANFAVIQRAGYDIDPADLPPHSQLFRSEHSSSSSEIRERTFKRQPISDLVTPEVESYINRYNLYRGTTPQRSVSLKLDPRALIVADDRNPVAVELATSLQRLEDAANPNCIIVIGGDGTMIRAIRRHWRLRLPFIGLNAGHRGHLLNDLDKNGVPDVLESEKHVHQLPLLYSEVFDADGALADSSYAVNDTWVERASGQAAWIQVKVNNEIKIPKLVADGALVATASGSTAYAKAMGGKPLLVGAQEITLVGSNVTAPFGFKSASLPLDAAVEFESLNPQKRPIRAFVDGLEKGVVSRVKTRVSRIAAVEVAFSPKRDMAAKLADFFFTSAS